MARRVIWPASLGLRITGLVCGIMVVSAAAAPSESIRFHKLSSFVSIRFSRTVTIKKPLMN